MKRLILFLAILALFAPVHAKHRLDMRAGFFGGGGGGSSYSTASNITVLNSNTTTAVPAWNGSNPTFVQWDATIVDGLSIAPAAGGTTITIGVTGTYAIHATINYGSQNSWIGLAILKNSTTWGTGWLDLWAAKVIPNSGAYVSVPVVYPYESLTAADVLRLGVAAATGASLASDETSTARIVIQKLQ